MTAGRIDLESATLRAIAVVNGHVRAPVFLYRLDAPETPIVADDVNVVQQAAREKLMQQIPEADRADAAPLLAQLAQAVAAERAKPKADREATTTEPFPPVAPWETAVDGAGLLESVMQLITRYVVLPTHAPVIIALWVLHTYLADAADFTPYLWVHSPVRGCGKSTLLDVLVHLASRACLSQGITAAALYRRIDRLAPTMLMDELDTRLRGDGGEILRGVLNSGFHRNGKVTICVGDDHEERDFTTYCPKVLAGIGRLWDTVASRSIPIRMERAAKADLSRVEKMRGDTIAALCEPTRRQCQRWADDHRLDVRERDPACPDALGARECDVWRPLFAIAEAVGGEWPARARDAALKAHELADEDGDWAVLLLEDVRAMFEAKRGQGDADKLTSAEIVDALAKMEHRPWPEYRNDRPITTRGLASLLGRFDIKPKNVKLDTGKVAKGYEHAQCLHAFERYLPQPVADSASGSGSVADTVADMTACNPLSHTPVAEVADAVPGYIGAASFSGPALDADDARYLELEREAMRDA